jgi:LruC domain-containing protein
MDAGYMLRRMTIDSDKTLLRGRHGEAVINLFECGHWVVNHELNSVGNVQTLFYNTEKEDRENYSATVPPVTRTYRVNFKNRAVARDVSFDMIDPFIVQEYNGGLWEIHTYRYKFDETLNSIFNGKSSYYDNHVSWAIVVPQRDFRYPIERMSLGTYNSELGETFGPYTSFADWMKDHTANNDWYLNIRYPQLLY